MTVTVTAPATTANLGPGFDCFGCALGLFATVTFESIEGGPEFIGGPTKFHNERNLIYVSFSALFKRAGLPVPGVRITEKSEIPCSRGLGSSAAMIVCGLLGGNAFLDRPLSTEELLSIATGIEGHPDNVAPCLYGGLCISMNENGTPLALSRPLSDRLRFTVCIPDYEFSTAKARQLVPATVSRADAVFNIGHAAFLLAALEQGNLPLLNAALKDTIHQPYRFPHLPDSPAVRRAAAELGFPCCISGAGPTLLVLSDRDDTAERLQTLLKGQLNEAWKFITLPTQKCGAVAERS